MTHPEENKEEMSEKPPLSIEAEKGENAEHPPEAPLPEESHRKEIEALRTEVQKKEQESKELYDQYLRTLADFENYKKRAQKDQVEQAKFANEKLVSELLPVIDNLERALSHSKETRDFDKMVEGVELIHKQFLAVLGRFGISPIESLDKPFDPFLHQSIGQVELEEGSSEAENQVVREAQKGYFLNERVLRPSLVMISKKKTSAPDPSKEKDTGEGTDS